MMACDAAEGVLGHLLFHKAMIDESKGSEKMNAIFRCCGAQAPRRRPVILWTALSRRCSNWCCPTPRSLGHRPLEVQQALR